MVLVWVGLTKDEITEINKALKSLTTLRSKFPLYAGVNNAEQIRTRFLGLTFADGFDDIPILTDRKPEDNETTIGMNVPKTIAEAVDKYATKLGVNVDDVYVSIFLYQAEKLSRWA